MRSRRYAFGTAAIGAAIAAAVAAPTAGAAPTAPASPALAASPAPPSHRAHGVDTDALQSGLDAIISGGGTGAVAEITEHGRPIWRGRSGVADRGTDRKVPLEGRFRAGSVTKMFVGTVVLQLVQEHRLGLDDSVESHLPGLVPDGEHITVRELLDHTSGLFDVTKTLPLNPPSGFLAIRYRTWTAAELVARATSQPPTAKPGKEAHYSSTDYIVLGMIIRQVTGNSYATEIERRIIRPLHLSDTELPGTDVRLHGRHLNGYLPVVDDTGMHVVDITEINPSVMNAAGEIISTTRDLDRFVGALVTGRLLRPDLQKEMLTPVLESKFGLGVEQLDPTCHVQAWGHDGDAVGYSTWTFATTTGRTATVSFTWGTDRPSAQAKALLDQALCPTH